MIHALLTAVVAAAGWSTPQMLSNGAIALGPELAVAPSGAALAVWDHEAGPDCAQVPASLTCAHIVEFSERPSPLGWDSPREIARPGIGARPQVAVNDAGRAAVIWVHDIGRDRVVQATYRTGASESFPNPSDLSAAVLEVRSHHVALDAAGNAVVVWAERHDRDFDAAAAIRSVTAGGWAAPTVLSTGPVQAGPALAVTPNGEAFAAWIQGSALFVARGDLTSGVWDAPAKLADDAAAGVAVAASAKGDVVVGWGRTVAGVGVALRTAGAWAQPVDLVGNGLVGAVGDPDVSFGADGTAVVAWEGDGRVQAAARSPGGAWSNALTVGASDTAEPHVAVDAHGNAILLWRGDDARLLTSVLPAGGQWQPAEEVSGAEASEPRLGLDATGAGFAVWNLQQGESLPVMTSAFAAWAPTLANSRRPFIRGRARIGATLTCERGTWTGTIPIRYTFGWLRNGHAGARGSTYRVKRNDTAARLACRVSAANLAGVQAATSAAVRVR